MKVLRFVSIALLMITISAKAQPGRKTITLEGDGQPSLKFEEILHNFGNLVEGTQATFKFKYTNTGKAPLILSDVKPPCSCTTTEWPKDPLLPGKSAIIKVTFDSKGKSGSFSKTIEVKHNGESGRDYITIKGMVGT